MGVIFVLGTRSSFVLDGKVQYKDTTITEQMFHKFYTAVGNPDHTLSALWPCSLVCIIYYYKISEHLRRMFNGRFPHVLMIHDIILRVLCDTV